MGRAGVDAAEIVRVRGVAALRALFDAAAVAPALNNGSELAGPPAAAAATVTARDLRKLTDLANARRLVARHGADLRYSYERERWLVWDGRRWAWDETGEVERRAKETVAAMAAEQFADEGAYREQRLKWCLRSEGADRLAAMVRLARSEPGVPVRLTDLDRDHWMLVCANGTLDLRTGRLGPFDRAAMLTQATPVAYDPAAEAPRWTAFLDRVLDGSVDLLAYAARVVGYCLTGETREQALFMLHGETGNNGKSTFLELIRAILGDYAKQASVDTFMVTKDGGIRNDVAALRGARFVVASESEEGRRLAENMVKQVTGDDVLTARFLFGEFFEFRPTFKVVICSNHKPVIRGTDRAIWRRVRMIPFTVTIPDAEVDRELSTKLRAELPGILAWAVRGCAAWRAGGLADPAEVRLAVEQYRMEMDTVGAFLGERTVRVPNEFAAARELYRAYAEWCEGSGERPTTQRVFGQKVLGRPGIEPSRTRTLRGYMGLRLVKAGEGDGGNYQTEDIEGGDLGYLTLGGEEPNEGADDVPF